MRRTQGRARASGETARHRGATSPRAVIMLLSGSHEHTITNNHNYRGNGACRNGRRDFREICFTEICLGSENALCSGKLLLNIRGSWPYCESTPHPHEEPKSVPLMTSPTERHDGARKDARAMHLTLTLSVQISRNACHIRCSTIYVPNPPPTQPQDHNRWGGL